MAQENEHKFYVTKEGLDELKKEQDNLIHVVRQEVIVELQEARAQGDLSENADYDAARDHQAQVEARIRELENMISNAVIIEGSSFFKSGDPGVDGDDPRSQRRQRRDLYDRRLHRGRSAERTALQHHAVGGRTDGS